MEKVTDQIEAFLLCGGGSRRLGYPKEMLRVDGEPLAAKMVQRLKEAFASVSVVSNRPEFLRYCLDVPVYQDEFRDSGPLAGLHAALAYAVARKCFILACDMPLVHNGLVRFIADRALQSDAPAVIAGAGGRRQPLCGVFDVQLLPLIERHLSESSEKSVNGFVETVGTEVVEVPPRDAGCFRDIDTPEDVAILSEAFEDVEPLPVSSVPVSSGKRDSDIVAEEWPVAVYVNSLKLVTVLCLPTALRELGVGLAAYLGLVRSKDDILAVGVDYRARRVEMELAVGESQIRKAAQLLVTSTCGANVYGPQLPVTEVSERPGQFRVARTHVLECIRGMRAMAPVFSVTGGTHQAAFSDGRSVQMFFEDIGRHNAVDKVVGRALMEGRDLSSGLLVSTGRLSSEMVVKAVRREVPILASRSAVTTNAIRLAGKYGLTLVGFARADRVNVYTEPRRVKDE